jgi:hypothetical protein
MDVLGCGVHLRLGFHRARAGDDLDLVTAQLDSLDVDNRILFVPFACHDLVGLDDVHGLFHAGQGVDQFLIQLALVADGADHGAFRAA